MSSAFNGSFVLVLHSHIPYVLGHDSFEEQMLFEAVAESYLPLLRCFERLMREGISPHITVSVSPTLTEQLADPYLKKCFREYCLAKVLSASKDCRCFGRHDLHMEWLAMRWEAYYMDAHRRFVDTLDEDVPARDRADVEDILAENGIEYFMIDGHQPAKSWPFDLHKTPFEPYQTGGWNGHRPVSVLSRDIGLSLQVLRH